ncbi:hypothetical protein ACFY3N_14630 [Streptomyces sp. NPDC000348]|uniref:hypothetical protein n=1 Tax=Streptomyces sp. NPDC000348 TaxID=3364538 RepID=UPI00368A5753
MRLLVAVGSEERVPDPRDRLLGVRVGADADDVEHAPRAVGFQQAMGAATGSRMRDDGARRVREL